MPAMRKLLEAFTRWREEEEGHADVFFLSSEKVANALGIELQTRSIPCPAPIAFLESLPSVDLAELTEDSRDCGICTQSMAPLGSCNDNMVKDVNDDVIEEAIRLPCSHVIGSKCLARWLHPLEPANNNTCPYCRAVCFPAYQPVCTLEGIQARLDALDWCIHVRGTGPTPNEVKHIRKLTSLVLQDRLIEALIELEASRAEVDKEVAEQTGMAHATYKGPRRAPCSTLSLAKFFIRQQFLNALTIVLALRAEQGIWG